MAKHIYGSLPSGIPEGFSKRVHFPVLAKMDQTTGDHRRLASEGGAMREPEAGPWSIRTQPAATYGHEGAVPSGALYQTIFDTDTGIVSGDGFILDDEMGLQTLKWVTTGAQRGNSVDLADIKAEYVEDMDSGEWFINFYEWNVGATTFVGMPAFAEAYGEIVAAWTPEQDELIASLLAAPDEPLVVEFALHTSNFDGELPEREVTADGALRATHAHFFKPEPETLQKFTVFEDGTGCGHLGSWESCHEGMPSCVRIPRPTDAYSSFNKPGVLTERGVIQTGPIFALGGHRTLIGKITPAEEAAAYGGVENAWFDARVTEGRLGPWISGAVRPGTDPNVLYAARASRISGHWKGGKLKAIVSVNAEGYDIPGDDRELVASLEFGVAEDGEMELVASFPACMDGTTPALPDRFSAEDIDALTAHIKAQVLTELAAAGEAASRLAQSGVVLVEPDEFAAMQAALAGDDDDD